MNGMPLQAAPDSPVACPPTALPCGAGDVQLPLPLKPNAPGRVRTGCMVCRARKVKCDETRPVCGNCSRLQKACVYRTPYHRALPCSSPSDVQEDLSRQEHQPVDAVQSVPESPSLSSGEPPGEPPVEIATTPLPEFDSRPLLQDDDASTTTTDASPEHFERISRDILYITTLDMIESSAEPAWPFSYFVQEVGSPLFVPFDRLNWTRAKVYIARLGAEMTPVAIAIRATHALHLAQMNRLPLVNAMMQYQAAVAAFESLADCQDSDFSTVMVVAFLLCLCMVMLPNEDSCIFHGFDGNAQSRLEEWLCSSHRAPVPLRLCAWLQLLDAAVKRGGSPGLLPHAVVRLLDQHIHDVPSLAVPDSDSYSDSCSDAGNVLYDFVSGPIFCFYRHLQMLSNEVASVSHYHRSRVTPDDQAEAADIVAGIQARLSSLWEARPGPLRFPPPTIRAHFGSAIAEPLVALAGICIVAYLAEVVAIGRTLADPPFAGPEAVEAMQLIRNLVDSNEWNAAGRDGLNAGYLRALFLYAIETGEETQTRWAVDRLRQINDPLSRSEFAASLAESLGETQRKNRRRVTVKYFCYKMFGVPTPFM